MRRLRSATHPPSEVRVDSRLSTWSHSGDAPARKRVSERRGPVGYGRIARVLLTSGVTPSSIAMYPVRRRLPRRARTQLDVSGSVSLIAAPDDPLIPLFTEVFVDRVYELSGLSLAGTTIVDVGANVGVFTVWAAAHYPGARLVAVEPVPRSVEFLRRNIARNGVPATVIAQACAGEPGPVTLYSRGPRVAVSMFPRDVYGSEFVAVDEVAAVTLDQVFDSCAIERCGLLKLDCEGAEYDILLSATPRTLARIDALVVEYHLGMNEHEPAELAEVLLGAGLDVQVSQPYDEEGGYLYARRP